MRILLIGRKGQIGAALAERLPNLGPLSAVDRSEVDLDSRDAIRTTLDDRKPQLIVNAAAYTDVDGAETDPETAFRVNAVAPGEMAAWAAANDATFLHYSTDYVFDGSGTHPWREEDQPNPINVYGESKLAGDNAVLSSGGRCLILRTSWIYAAQGRNFMRTILRLAAEREELRVVADQFGAPTSAEVVADATLGILGKARQSAEGQDAGQAGVVNVAAGGETSWHGFAVEICTLAREAGLPLRVKRIEAIPASEYPLPAARPANSRLALERLAESFGIVPPSWQAALRSCFDTYMAVR